MKRSAKSRKARRPSLVQTAVAAAGAATAQNPVLVGGGTAFLVTFFFVSANAVWYQPYAHTGAFFATREIARAVEPAEPETTIHIEREEMPQGDPVVEEVQGALMRLNLYAGPVDGLAGPQTRKAVEEYQRILGIRVTGEIDEYLLEQMQSAPEVVPAAPTAPVPDPAPRRQTAEPAAFMTVSNETVSSTLRPTGDPRVVRVQAGLKAFGNDGIEIDGIMGSKTRAAIREFQSLFGLPVTGEVDDVLYAKMQEVGLTN